MSEIYEIFLYPHFHWTPKVYLKTLIVRRSRHPPDFIVFAASVLGDYISLAHVKESQRLTFTRMCTQSLESLVYEFLNFKGQKKIDSIYPEAHKQGLP